MKKHFLSFCLLLTANCQLVFSQMAGNSTYNQAAENYKSSLSLRGSRSNSESITGYEAPKMSNYDYQQQTQTYYTSSVANAWVISDTVFELSVNALMNAHANSYVVSLGVSQAAGTIDSCQQIINERINNFIAQLMKSGIKKEDIFIDFVSQVPVFEVAIEKKIFSKRYNELPSGFELKKNIHIAYRKNETLDEIVTLAAKSEIYDIIKVDYIINTISAVYDTLRNASIKLLNEKAEDYKKLGIKFNPKFQVMAEDVQAVYPIERYKSYTAYNNSSLQALKKSGVSSTSITYQPKQATLYYDKLPYNNYDIVINPVVIEPAAQFTYSLKVRYTYKDDYVPKEKVTPITTTVTPPKK
ncbi:MAG: SIMPL domain-containing protein [Bacteroidetes bacterium]|nr:SIMPL domain-containing protein [Bacteroidota bacterium]